MRRLPGVQRTAPAPPGPGIRSAPRRPGSGGEGRGGAARRRAPRRSVRLPPAGLAAWRRRRGGGGAGPAARSHLCSLPAGRAHDELHDREDPDGRADAAGPAPRPRQRGRVAHRPVGRPAQARGCHEAGRGGGSRAGECGRWQAGQSRRPSSCPVTASLRLARLTTRPPT